MIKQLMMNYQKTTNFLPHFDGLPALLLRLFLGPIFIMAGYSKMAMSSGESLGISGFFASEDIVAWFGSDWGLNLPFPELLANLATWSEFFGGWLLLIGLLTRLLTLPLMFTMIIAATTVHLDNGWFAITPTNSSISSAKVFDWLGVDAAKISIENSDDTAIKLEKMRDILSDNGNTDWLYGNGPIVVLNNGIEFATTYFIMLLALFFIGAGRYTSVDYFLKRYLMRQHVHTELKY